MYDSLASDPGSFTATFFVPWRSAAAILCMSESGDGLEVSSTAPTHPISGDIVTCFVCSLDRVVSENRCRHMITTRAPSRAANWQVGHLSIQRLKDRQTSRRFLLLPSLSHLWTWFERDIHSLIHPAKHILIHRLSTDVLYNGVERKPAGSWCSN